jgi:deoxycytidylate deaminase
MAIGDAEPWEVYLMEQARYAAMKSTCHSKKIGAVCAWIEVGEYGDVEYGEVSSGWNRPLPGFCEDQCEWPIEERHYKSDLKGCTAVHGEAAAVLEAGRMDIATEGLALFCACGIPCAKCLVTLYCAGIKDIYCLRATYYDEETERILQQGLFSIHVLRM